MLSRYLFRSASISRHSITLNKPKIFCCRFNEITKFTTMPISSALGLKQRHEENERVQKKFFGDNIKENIWTIPNGLCVLRISLTPIIGYLVVQHSFFYACILFTFAGVTDLVDGLIARTFPSQRSMLGSVLDPVADKFLISVLFVTLTYVDLIPLLLTSIIILRDICLIVGGIIRRYQLLQPPVTFRRFFDPSVSSMNITPTLVSKLNTVLQVSLAALSLASPVFDFAGHPALTGLCFLTGGTTIYSGLQYIGGDAMRPVKRSNKK